MAIKLSVIIPFFNRMQYITQLVESIPVCADVEVLIIDDKSAVGETQQLVAYVDAQRAHRNIRYLYNDQTKSAGTCRNIGLRHAAGEWVLFADSDDYFTSDLYQTIAPWFDTDYDLVYFTPTSQDRLTGLVAERHIGGETLIHNYRTNPCPETEARLKSFYVEPWSKLFRKRTLDENAVLFDEVIASNDVMFSTKAAFAAQKFAVSEDVIYCVTKSPGSLYYSVDKVVLDARFYVFIDHYQYMMNHLPKAVFYDFNLNGRNHIIKYITQKQSLATVLGVVRTLIKNRVPLFEARLLNPFVVARAIKGYFAEYQRNRNYYKTSAKPAQAQVLESDVALYAIPDPYAPMQVSVIIPFFNRMQYIAQLIESIPVRSDIEILIIDDKSETGEMQQLRAYITQQQEMRNIRYFYNDQTKSAGTCRNIGLRYAVGEWILFADSDDYFVPNFYDTLAPWLQDDKDIVYFTPTSIDRLTGLSADRHLGGKNLIDNYLQTPSAENFFRLKTFFSEPWSKLYRGSFLRANKIFFDEIMAWNDLMFSVKASFAAGQIAVSQSEIYCVTKSPGSLVYSVDKTVLDARLCAFISHYHFIKERVPKEIFMRFNLNGRSRTMQYITQKQSMGTVCGVIVTLAQNRIPLFELRLLNPVIVARALKGYLSEYRRDRLYYKASEAQATPQMQQDKAEQ